MNFFYQIKFLRFIFNKGFRLVGSRPHSSTSAELEQGLASINISAAPPAQITRGKDTPRFKGKRMYPSIPNQPSEAGAHFMFELAKTVLNKAGGNSSTSLFTQVCIFKKIETTDEAAKFYWGNKNL